MFCCGREMMSHFCLLLTTNIETASIICMPTWEVTALWALVVHVPPLPVSTQHCTAGARASSKVVHVWMCVMKMLRALLIRYWHISWFTEFVPCN